MQCTVSQSSLLNLDAEAAAAAKGNLLQLLLLQRDGDDALSIILGCSFRNLSKYFSVEKINGAFYFNALLL